MKLKTKAHLPFLETRPTCQGYSLAKVSSPPTILLAVLARPQVQELLEGGEAVVEGVEGVEEVEVVVEELYTSM